MAKLPDTRYWPLKRLAWAFGCAPARSIEADYYERKLIERIKGILEEDDEGLHIRLLEADRSP